MIKTVFIEMKKRVSLLLSLILITMVAIAASCSSKEGPTSMPTSSASPAKEQKPATPFTCTASAFYKPGPGNRTLVVINGFQLKPCTKEDVKSKGQTEGGALSPEKNAISVKDPSATFCEAQLAHGTAAYVKTFFQIQCANGSTSGWIEVRR
jgi:hypothetical protein